MNKKRPEMKQNRWLERMKQQAEARGDKAAEEVKLKAKKAPSQRASHETRHEFH